jgi:hypothetical protein
MEKKAKKPRFSGVPAWVLSLIILIILVALLIMLNDPKSSSLSTVQFLGYMFYVILVTVACFFICKAHPNSVWYTLVICNAMGIIALIGNLSFTIVQVIAGRDPGIESADWFLIASILLSVVGAIVGARMGRRKLNPVSS